MEQLIITIEGKSNVDLVIRLMRKFNFVKSIVREKNPSHKTPPANVVSEPVEEYNWIDPSRPATDEEFEQLAIEMEQDLEENSSKDVINFVKKELKAWRKAQK
jgi:hypothetical protein